MKDFYDILFLAENNKFFKNKLKKALLTTFKKRQTDINRRIDIYTESFIKDKSLLWKTFLKKLNNDTREDFKNIIKKIKNFIEPVILDKSKIKLWHPDIWKWN